MGRQDYSQTYWHSSVLIKVSFLQRTEAIFGAENNSNKKGLGGRGLLFSVMKEDGPELSQPGLIINKLFHTLPIN